MRERSSLCLHPAGLPSLESFLVSRYPRPFMALRKFLINAAKFVSQYAGLMSGALSIPFAFLALFKVSQRLLFGVLAYAALAVMAISDRVRVSKLQNELDYQLTPRLNTECHPDIPGCSQPAPWANFFRIAVTTEGIAAVENCRGRLTRISRLGEAQPRWSGDLAILTFAPGETPDATAKTIHEGVIEYLDVLFTTHNNEIGVATPNRQWPYVPNLTAIFDQPGIYLLTTNISGEGSRTVSVDLRFTWTGNWQTSQLAKI